MSATHVGAGLSGVEWCNACIVAVGIGKGGGKPALAMANIPCESEAVVDAIVNAANAFVSRF